MSGGLKTPEQQAASFTPRRLLEEHAYEQFGLRPMSVSTAPIVFSNGDPGNSEGIQMEWIASQETARNGAPPSRQDGVLARLNNILTRLGTLS
jgi:hypothetical protein